MFKFLDSAFYWIGSIICGVGFAWVCLLLFCLVRRICIILYKKIFGVRLTKGELRKVITRQEEEISKLKKDLQEKDKMFHEAQNAYISECSKYSDECDTTAAMKKAIKRLTEDLEFRDQQITKLNEEVQKHQAEVEYKNETIAELQIKLADRSFSVREADKRKKRRKK